MQIWCNGKCFSDYKTCLVKILSLDTNSVVILAFQVCPDLLFFTEAQERYVLAVDPNGLKVFRSIAERERCAYSVRNLLNDLPPILAPV